MENLKKKLCEQCRLHDKEHFKEEALHSALGLKHSKCAEELIAAGANVNYVNKHGSLLETPAASGSLDNVQLLLKAGANVNQKTRGKKCTALLVAVGAADVDCTKLLLEAGADVNHANKHGSLLAKAAASGSLDKVQLLLKAGTDVNQVTRGNNYTPLLGAVVAGSVECVELLIATEADVNLRKECKTSAIMQAVQKGYPKIVQVLLKAGADVNDIDYSNSWTALMLAAWKGDDNVVDVLIKAGADVNKLCLLDTALKLAAECSNKNIETHQRKCKHCLEMLIEAGADVNANPNRVSALNIACRKGFDDGVELLINSGADVNMLGDTGLNPLMEAASNGRVRCAELILEAGVDVNFHNSRGTTALMCVGSKTPMFDYQGEISWSPEVIEKKACLNCTKLLLRSGAKINLIDMYSGNALQHQMAPYNHSKGSDDICLLLYAAGETLDGPLMRRSCQIV